MHTRQVSPPHAPTVCEVVSPSSARARRALWSYTEDVASRYYGRPATAAEVEASLRDDPSEDLDLPAGLFLVAQQNQEIVGCAGLRLLPDAVGEVKRVHVVPAARGRGLGACLMGELERLACQHGRSRLRLDTRSDLVEARRLYVRLGYREVPPFNAGQYAEHWFEKTLTRPVAGPSGRR